MLRPPTHAGRISCPRGGFARGTTWITREGERGSVALMDFGICRLRRGSAHRATSAKESLWILLRGRAELGFCGRKESVSRRSLYSEGPVALNLGGGESVEVRSIAGDTEWAVVRATNPRMRGARLYLADEVGIGGPWSGPCSRRLPAAGPDGLRLFDPA